MPRDFVETYSSSTPLKSGLDAYDDITMATSRLRRANELLGEFAVNLPNETGDLGDASEQLLFLGDAIRRYIEDLDRAAENIPTEKAAMV